MSVLQAEDITGQGSPQPGQPFINPDRRAGDVAFAAKDYPVAVSFYTKYLQDSQKKADRKAEYEAYERLLDAAILGKLTAPAEKYLNEYEKKFVHKENAVQTIQLWRADILFQKGKYKEAGDAYRTSLSHLTGEDPRRFRVMFSYGLTLKKQQSYKEAAVIFSSMWKKIRNLPQEHFVFEQLILCLTAAKQYSEAVDLMMENQPETAEENTIYALLSAYIGLNEQGIQKVSGMWKNLLRIYPVSPSAIGYLTASAYGDAFLHEKGYSSALSSYRAAFQTASDKEEMFETLSRMVTVISSAGDTAKAAQLAMSQLDLFKHSLLSPAVKLRTADLLQKAGNERGAMDLYESVFANIKTSDGDRRQALYEYASLLGRQNRLPEAFKVIRDQYKNSSPQDGEFLLGEVLVRLQRPEDFIRHYESIAARWPELTHRALLCSARACMDTGKPEEALKIVNRLKTLPGTSNEPELYYIEGSVRALKHENEQALMLYDKFLQTAAAKDRLRPLALYHSGKLAFITQKFNLAVKQFKQLRQEYPDHELIPNASSWLIQTYVVLHDVIAAERETWLLIERYPGSQYAADALFRLAERYSDEGASEKAANTLRKLAADSRFPRIRAQAIYELALLSVRNKEYKEALYNLNQLYELFPDTSVMADAYYLNGDVLRYSADYRSAIEFYRKAALKRPNSALAAAACGSIGDCYYTIASADPANCQKELANALTVYDQMIRTSGCPAFFEAIASYRKGRCLELMNQMDVASEQYRQLLYKYPGSRIQQYPKECVWCVRAAEALVDLAARNPLRPTLIHARQALHWLVSAKMIKREDAVQRFEKLKQIKFNP